MTPAQETKIKKLPGNWHHYDTVEMNRRTWEILTVDRLDNTTLDKVMRLLRGKEWTAETNGYSTPGAFAVAIRI